MRALLPLALLAALAAACRGPREEPAVPRWNGPPRVVTGTVLDARTGRPIEGALVRGPGGAEALSDARGRFVLRGLAPDAAGEVVGTTEAGLRGANLLRGQGTGPLEVVLHLR